jgi:hypothetical protein
MLGLVHLYVGQKFNTPSVFKKAAQLKCVYLSSYLDSVEQLFFSNGEYQSQPYA